MELSMAMQQAVKNGDRAAMQIEAEAQAQRYRNAVVAARLARQEVELQKEKLDDIREARFDYRICAACGGGLTDKPVENRQEREDRIRDSIERSSRGG